MILLAKQGALIPRPACNCTRCMQPTRGCPILAYDSAPLGTIAFTVFPFSLHTPLGNPLVKFIAMQGYISREIIRITVMYGENLNLSSLTLLWVFQVTLPLRLRSHGVIRSGQCGTCETWLVRSGERNSIIVTDDLAALPNWPETENYLFLEKEFGAFASIPRGA